MSPTIRLFDNDAYGTDFNAQVISCEKVTHNDSDMYALILDQTLFFPEEGGQSPDKGTINSIPVIDVQIKDQVIYHFLDQPVEAGSQVSGHIDWQHRFNNMQQHSGEHIFSGITHNKYGYDNVGFHLSDQIVTMDFNGPLTLDQVEEIEWEVNEAIAKNLPITVSYPSKEELASIDYRSKIEIDGQVRLVTVTGYDVCACCAPHVRSTGEIGGLKVMSLSNYKGGVRISILCGFRALLAARENQQVLNSLTGYLTTGSDMLLDSVKKLKATNQELSSELSKAKQALLDSRLSGIPADQENVILFESGLDSKSIRNTINTLMESHPGICGIFNGNDNDGYNYVIGSKNLNCKDLASQLRLELGAKGGGNEKMIQGSLAAASSKINKLLSDFS